MCGPTVPEGRAATAEGIRVRHVVVTGSGGFIGSHLARLLASSGHVVVGMDRRPSPNADRSEIVDLARPLPGSAIEILRTADAVFHLAGCPGVRLGGPGVAERRVRDNVLAGARVLSAVPDDVPVVVASSSSVYGGVDTAGGRLRPSREDDPLRPRGGYARSKVALERLCEQRRAAGGHVAVVRPFTVAGEGQRPDMAISSWLDAVERGRAITVLGSLDRRRDVTDVRDVVDGMLRVARGAGTVTVNLGTGRSVTLRDILSAIEQVTGQETVVEIAGVCTSEPDATLADTSRCRRLLGFVPRADLAELVRRQTLARARPKSGVRQVLADASGW